MSGHGSPNVDRRRGYDKDTGMSVGGGRGAARDSRSGGHEAGVAKSDDPPNSRLFIVCGKQITEDQFRDAFGTFGHIEEVWVLKDRVTGEPKGITYIKFSKTSEAALAMEEMNGRCISGSPRPLKVMIAHSRDQGSRRDMNEEERLVRLFVVVSKTMTESELRANFEQFGDIDYVSLVRDRNTKESKGFAYVKYHRVSHAAKAFEECNRSFKPVFAEPKPQRPLQEAEGSGRGGGGHGGHGGDRYGGPGSTGSASSMSTSFDMFYMDTSQSNPDSIRRLNVTASSSVTQDQLWRLLDIVPGLDFCDRSRDRFAGNGRTSFSVVYNNPQSAAYAKEKLNGFEYPPGHRLMVKLDACQPFDGPHGGPTFGRPSYPAPAGNARGPAPALAHNAVVAPHAQANITPASLQNDVAQLKETIANATALLQAAGYATPNAASTNGAAAPGAAALSDEMYDPSYCSVKLPAPQPLAAMESPVAERLFVVCSPVPPPLYALKDVFGRFGHLIDVYLLNGKSCGYAKYASKESADRAVAALHGQEICGCRLKVMPADPQHDKATGADPGARKRQKFAEFDH